MDIFVLVNGEAKELTKEVINELKEKVTVIDANGKIIMKADLEVLIKKFGMEVVLREEKETSILEKKFQTRENPD